MISLLCFDSLYVAGGALESFRRCFKLYHDLHLILFAYFLYPMQAVVMTASIFMTVGIALERYIAVHYPIGNQHQILKTPFDKKTCTKL